MVNKQEIPDAVEPYQKIYWTVFMEYGRVMAYMGLYDIESGAYNMRRLVYVMLAIITTITVISLMVLATSLAVVWLAINLYHTIGGM